MPFNPDTRASSSISSVYVVNGFDQYIAGIDVWHEKEVGEGLCANYSIVLEYMPASSMMRLKKAFWLAW